METGPFDIGSTTLNGLGPLSECIDNPDPEIAHRAAMLGCGETSMSNGSMMRCTPMAVWARNLSTNDLRTAVKKDVSLMHWKTDMHDLVSAYCVAIGTLCKNAGNPERAQLAIEAVEVFGRDWTVSPLVLDYLDFAKGLARRFEGRKR